MPETPRIEILSINDRAPDAGVLITPNEYMVVNEVIQLWKQDPATESLGIAKLHALVKQSQPSWSVLEKRLKTLLKKYNLLANQPKLYYANEITSKETPHLELPNKIRLQNAKNKGKGLYALTSIPKDTLLWEEKPFIFIPPMDHIKLMRSGKACCYCGKLLQARGFDANSFLNGLDCKHCDELYCLVGCKKNDVLHPVLNHKKGKPPLVDPKKWAAYEEFCLENRWTAAFAVGLIRVHELYDKLGVVSEQFAAFARVSQEIRYKASDSSAGAFDATGGGGGALFVKEQQELLWKKGHEMFNQIFEVNAPKDVIASRQLLYEDYLVYIGTYNINNIESLYLIQSHLNHNCTANVDVRVIDSARRLCDGIRVYSARDLKAGEELVTLYVNPSHSVHQRKRELRVNWGFNCTCAKCKEEEKEAQRVQSSGKLSPAVPTQSTQATESPEETQKKPKRTSMRKSGEFSSIKEMLEGAEGEGEFELSEQEQPTGRRKSVRFDEKVVAVNNE